MRKKIIGYQLVKNGKAIKGLEPNHVFATSRDINIYIENHCINMRFVEIEKVYENDIKNPVFIDGYLFNKK